LRYYTAKKTRDQGRDRFSVIFRHPVRLDAAHGKPGRRVRRGLGTNDPVEADRLVSELDMLLSSEEFWSYSARGTAAGRFDPRVVAAFFDGMEPLGEEPSAALRDREIPLPTVNDGYRQVLLLGTTGAGKTTLVRQLLGTDPVKDRFPSTSTAKTTVADTEIVVAEGEFRAVVTFFPRDEVVDHLVDCASKAALAAFRGADDREIRRALLDHENQRFRFSYVLGRSRDAVSADGASDTEAQSDDLDDFDDGDPISAGLAVPEIDVFDAEPETLIGVDLDRTAMILEEAVASLKDLVAEHGETARAQLAVANEDDERIAKDILDEELDSILRSDERFNAVVDSLIDEIEKRFDAVPVGEIARDRQGWPSTWRWASGDRTAFLRAVNRFSSNYKPLFGQLLTPLVNGIRVMGPFRPTWLEGELPKLVLIDGEGLGHTPKSSAALPTAVVKVIESVDAVLLVDNASQPIQAASASAIRSLLTSGNADKLVFCFTHFDAVRGDNLSSPSDRARHVLASAENLLGTLREDFSPRAERAMRRRLDANRVFLAGIDQRLDAEVIGGRQSIAQLRKLVTMIDRVTDRPDLGPARPVYDKVNLILAVTAAASSFHRKWKAVLGITSAPDVDREHWTRVKALNRRYAEGTADQYDTLRPASDLRELLKDEIYKTLESPLRWTGHQPTDDVVVTGVIDELSQAIAKRLSPPIRERLSVRPQRSWQESYALTGSGSTFVRARRISEDVFGRNVPVPGAAPSPDQNDFLRSVITAVEEAAAEVGCALV
jgi:hypothetical protein